MHRSLIASAILIATAATATPKTVWVANSGLSTPESAHFDAESRQIFVSNVAGNAGDKDGRGWIATITFDKTGKPVVTKIVDGLNAPKGLRTHKGALWVTDIDEVIKIDVATAKIVQRVPVAGAKFLNDVAIAADGKVYVSDMIASKIYMIVDGKPSLFAEGADLESPNGLLIRDGKLVVAAWGLITDPTTWAIKAPGHLYSIDLTTKAKTLITTATLGNLDGLEAAANGDLLVSDWVAGKVYRVTQDGKATIVVEGIKNSADIGIQGNTLLVPAMGGDEVSAFSL